MRISISCIMACAAVIPVGAVAEEIVAPTPAATIYPGEIIRESMLYDALIDVRETRNVVRMRGELIGRIARRTLFVGKPIDASSIDEPQTIANGSLVQLVYEQPSISISASGLALQSARTGDPIRVRNVETGLVVTGVVSAAGLVMVGR